MARAGRGRRVWGWMAFDWATQPFYTLGLTFVFGPYFASVSLGHFEAATGDPDAARAASQALWFWGSTVAGLFVAFTAPLLGAYADSTGRRMPWIWTFAAIYVAATWSLWWAFPDASTLFLVLAAFNVGLVAAEYMLVFVNAILPSLGGRSEVGRISGDGAALGYWGGVASLLVMLLFLAENEGGKTLIGLDPALGLDPAAREGARSVGPFIAIWFAVFMIPFLLWVREPRPAGRAGGATAALADLRRSLSGVPGRPSLLNFLLSSMFYRDALNALYSAGGVYATLVLGWSIVQVGVFGIAGAVAAAVATQVGGILDSRLGPRPVIKHCCLALVAVTLVMVGMGRDGFYGVVALPDGSALPDVIFYACGAAIGGAGGALYAASRSMMARHADPGRPTEAFGLFALSGKATAFLVPMLIALFSTMTGSAQLGYVPVVLLFAVGLFLLRRVNPEGDREEWSGSEASSP